MRLFSSSFISLLLLSAILTYYIGYSKMVAKWKKYCHEFYFVMTKSFVRRKKNCHVKKIIIGVPKIRFCSMKNVLLNSKKNVDMTLVGHRTLLY